MAYIWCYDIVDEVWNQFSHSPLVLELHGPRYEPATAGRRACVLVSILSIGITESHWEEGIVIEKIPPHDWSVGKSVLYFLNY